MIWLARRLAGRLRPGDLLLIFYFWYGVRFLVESLKADNWTFFGVPTAQIIATLTVVGASGILIARHLRPSDVRRPEALVEGAARLVALAGRRRQPIRRWTQAACHRWPEVTREARRYLGAVIGRAHS